MGAPAVKVADASALAQGPEPACWWAEHDNSGEVVHLTRVVLVELLGDKGHKARVSSLRSGRVYVAAVADLHPLAIVALP